MIGLVVPTDPALPVSKIDVDGLDDYQAVVGGYIEVVIPLGRRDSPFRTFGAVGYVNEDGLMRGLPSNPRATELFGQPLVGDVLILETTGEDDRSVSDVTTAWATGSTA